MSERVISRQFCWEPEILYEHQWACCVRYSGSKLAGALNLSTTRELIALWNNNVETRRILDLWSDFSKELHCVRFASLWRHAHKGDYEYVMTAPTPPQIGVQNVTRESFRFVFRNWCIAQLMRMVPALFPRCNLEAVPLEFNAYDFFHAYSILRWASFHRRRRTQQSKEVVATSVRWHREPSTDRFGVPSHISSIATEEPATALASPNAFEPGHALLAASGDDNVGSPKDGAISHYTGARETLYQFAGELCEQFQQVRLSIESVKTGKDENDNIQFSGIDGLVDQYTKTIERSCIGGIAAENQVLGRLASHCAQMGNSARETGCGEKLAPSRDPGVGVKHTGKRFQAAPKTQINRRNNGVSKSRTRPSKVHKAQSEGIQAAISSGLAGTSDSTDQLDAANSHMPIELDLIIEVDLTED